MIDVIIEPTQTEAGFTNYEYPQIKENKIFYRQVNPEITESILHYSNNNRNNAPEDNMKLTRPKLAGDLKQEYTLHLTKQIYDTIHETVRESLCAVYQGEVINFSMDNPWVNYQRATEFNPIHNHTGLWSIVWYLDIPEVIRQEHAEQESNGKCRGLIEFSSMNSIETMKFNPRTSDFFLFSAKHPHQVYPFYSDVERVSMSLNILSLELNCPHRGIISI